MTIHGQADQLRIATVSRQREFLDRYAGDEVALAAYGKTWNALRAMDERLERLSSQESSMRQQADYLRESIERINRVDPQPGEMDELRARRDRIENAAEIAMAAGIPAVIMNGARPSRLYDLMEGQALGTLFVDPARHIVRDGEREVTLTLKEFQLLCLLMERAGTVFTRDQLLNTIWGYEFDGASRTVDVHIRTLRQKLGRSGDCIETVRGVGYKIGADDQKGIARRE